MRLFILVFFIFNSVCLNAQTRDEVLKEGNARFDSMEYADALRKSMEGLALFPDDPKLLILKALCLYKLDDVSDAYETLTYLIKMHPASGEGYVHRGLLLKYLQEFEMSLKDMEKAVELAKTDSARIDAYLLRGSAKMDLREFTGAYNDFMTAYQIDSTNISVLNSLVLVCKEVGKPEMVYEYLERVLRVNPNDLIAIANTGFELQEDGQYDSAIHYHNRAIAIDSTLHLAYSNRGFCYYKLGKLDEALKDVDYSLELMPSNSFAYRTKALIHIAKGQTDQACEAIEMALLYKFTTVYGDEVEELKKKYCQ